MISNCTGRLVFCWRTKPRRRTEPPVIRSFNRSATRSQPRSLLSIARSNSAIAAGDTLVLNHVTAGTFGAYVLNAHGFGAGSCTIDVRNVSLGSLSEAIVIRYAIIKAVQA